VSAGCPVRWAEVQGDECRSHLGLVWRTMSRGPSSLILLHGFGSSFDHNWRQTGWVDILADFGVTVPAIDLPGHGSSSAPTHPAAYAHVDEEIRRALPADEVIAGVGFSAGAELLLRLACAEPERFDRIVLLGLGDNAFDPGDPTALVAALESSEEPEDVRARLFRRLARSAGNDPKALSAFLRRPRQSISENELSRLHCPILVVLGDRDWVGPADRLMAALPSASLVTLSGVDHFATPSDIGAIDATVKFLGIE
jgi:pimeloyl-ACP methyl ester carboxylesterase